jgi:hypothetical protein
LTRKLDEIRRREKLAQEEMRRLRKKRSDGVERFSRRSERGRNPVFAGEIFPHDIRDTHDKLTERVVAFDGHIAKLDELLLQPRIGG